MFHSSLRLTQFSMGTFSNKPESAVEVLLERCPVSPGAAMSSSTVRHSLGPQTNPFICPGFRLLCQRVDCVWSPKSLRLMHRDTFTDASSNSNTTQRPTKICVCIQTETSPSHLQVHLTSVYLPYGISRIYTP